MIADRWFAPIPLKYPMDAHAWRSILILSLLLFNAMAGWVDPDTPEPNHKLRSYSDGKLYDLVMSDEFNRDGRSFTDGHDPMWTAIDKSDDDLASNGRSLEFYNSSSVYTKGGNLVIETNTEDTKWTGFNPYTKKDEEMVRNFKSGMVQGWNKFCYTGGILEIDLQLPGQGWVGGLWPAMWLLGNLGRATYVGSTNLVWPWSTDKCDRELQHAQEFSACSKTAHYSLNPGQGRGATEIDLLEVMGGYTELPLVETPVQQPFISMTLQVAPGIPKAKKRPPPGTLPKWGFHWYDKLSYGPNVSINPFFYGNYLGPTKKDEPSYRGPKQQYQCDAVGSLMGLSYSFWRKMHTFRLEWQPGPKGYVHWYIDGVFRFGIEAEGLLKENAVIPNEPSYVILNTAVSTTWGFPEAPKGCDIYDCKVDEGRCGFSRGFCDMMPASYLVDHIRIYQNKDDPSMTVGCNPKEYPTKSFIKAHEYRYMKLTDKVSLFDVVAGGQACETDGFCGEGTCVELRCVCNAGWTGPRCLVPAYANDVPDWDVDHWGALQAPYVPSFLGAGATVFAIAVSTLIVAVYRKRVTRSI